MCSVSEEWSKVSRCEEEAGGGREDAYKRVVQSNETLWNECFNGREQLLYTVIFEGRRYYDH